MAEIVAASGIVMAAYCAFAALRPGRALDWIFSMEPSRRFTVAIAVRIVFGLVFVVAAPDCARPQVIRVLGLIALAAAGVIAIMGRERLDAFVGWLADKPASFVSAWLLTGVAFGLLVVWAAVLAA